MEWGGGGGVVLLKTRNWNAFALHILSDSTDPPREQGHWLYGSHLTPNRLLSEINFPRKAWTVLKLGWQERKVRHLSPCGAPSPRAGAGRSTKRLLTACLRERASSSIKGIFAKQSLKEEHLSCNLKATNGCFRSF